MGLPGLSMKAIAKGRIICFLAGTKPNRAIFLNSKHQGNQPGPPMSTIAEWRQLAEAALAPVISFTSLQLHLYRENLHIAPI